MRPALVSVKQKSAGHFCAVCGAETCIGDDIFPLNVEGTKKIEWAHASCHRPGEDTIPDCRHWLRLNHRCPMEEQGCCAFGHRDNAKPLQLKRKKWGGKRRVIQNSFTTNCFRIWLAQTFTLEFLKSGEILDVGGGKGELSFMLKNLMGVDSCVFDPRPLSLSTMNARWSKGMFEPKRVGPVFSRWNPEVVDGSSQRQPLTPKHARLFFRHEEVLEVRHSESRSNCRGQSFPTRLLCCQL